MTTDNAILLPLIDDIWGQAEELKKSAAAMLTQAKAEADRIQAQLVAIKQTAGLDNPPKA